MSVEGDGWLPVPSSALGLPSIQGVAQDSSGGDLPWQSVDVTALHSGTTSFEDGGFLGLEVVEGDAYTVTQTDEAGGVIVPCVNQAEQGGSRRSEAWTAPTAELGELAKSTLDGSDPDAWMMVDLSAWDGLNLHPVLLRALALKGFTKPTPIQEATLPPALLHHKDVIGTAETGSGKTLAYLLPIVQRLLVARARRGLGVCRTTSPLAELVREHDRHFSAPTGAAAVAAYLRGEDAGEAAAGEADVAGPPEPTEARDAVTDFPRFWDGLPALILCPTRELALQVRDHANSLLQGTVLRCVAVVGGLSQHKHSRMLKRRPDIVVATPGRLWDMVRSGKHAHLSSLRTSLRFLVLDEADRLVAPGHFADLAALLHALHPGTQREDSTDDIAAAALAESTAPSTDQAGAGAKHVPVQWTGRGFRQTCLFSATLTAGAHGGTSSDDLIRAAISAANVGGTLTKGEELRLRSELVGLSPLEIIQHRVGMRPRPAIVSIERSLAPAKAAAKTDTPADSSVLRWGDVTEGEGSAAPGVEGATRMALPSGLRLFKVVCAEADKTEALYTYLLTHPGRVVVFVNAISVLKHVAAACELLDLPTFALHAHLQQKQRVKRVNRFATSSPSVLICTDVVARGIDAVALVSPRDLPGYNRLLSALHMPEGLPSLVLDSRYHRQVVARLSLVKRILAAERDTARTAADQLWLKRSTEASDLAADEDMLREVGTGEGRGALSSRLPDDEDDLDMAVLHTAAGGATQSTRMGGRANRSAARTPAQARAQRAMRQELAELMAQPLLPTGTSQRYITSAVALQSLGVKTSDAAGTVVGGVQGAAPALASHLSNSGGLVTADDIQKAANTAVLGSAAWSSDEGEDEAEGSDLESDLEVESADLAQAPAHLAHLAPPQSSTKRRRKA
ncbi:DDX24 [Symbiodinium sp. KB8]|nr:DDX24 [Symbiodinium sp. KB8]